jgi:hypothetical protein
VESFEEFFLEKADVLKYRVFKFLAKQSHEVTITDVSRSLNINYQATYNVFQEILFDLVEIRGETRPCVRRLLLAGKPGTLDLDRYRVWLISNSISFKLFDAALTIPGMTVAKFCDLYFISPSTVTRRSRQVKPYLNAYGITLDLHYFRMHGSEYMIRLFYQQLYWRAYHGCEWPFPTITEQFVNERLLARVHPRNDVILDYQERLLTAIAHLRDLGRNQLPPLRPLHAMVAKYWTLTHANQPYAVADLGTLDDQFCVFTRLTHLSFEPTNLEQDQLTLEALRTPLSDAVLAVLTPGEPLTMPLQQRLNIVRLIAQISVYGRIHGVISMQQVDKAVEARVEEAFDHLPDDAQAILSDVWLALVRWVSFVLTDAAVTPHGLSRLKVRVCLGPHEPQVQALKARLHALNWVDVLDSDDMTAASAVITKDEHRAVPSGERKLIWFDDALSEPVYWRVLIQELQKLRH